MIKGNTIEFDWVLPNNAGIGKWKTNAGGSELQSTWATNTRDYNGTWNLKRIELMLEVFSAALRNFPSVRCVPNAASHDALLSVSY